MKKTERFVRGCLAYPAPGVSFEAWLQELARLGKISEHRAEVERVVERELALCDGGIYSSEMCELLSAWLLVAALLRVRAARAIVARLLLYDKGVDPQTLYCAFLAARLLFDSTENAPCPEVPGSTMIAILADRALEAVFTHAHYPELVVHARFLAIGWAAWGWQERLGAIIRNPDAQSLASSFQAGCLQARADRARPIPVSFQDRRLCVLLLDRFVSCAREDPVVRCTALELTAWLMHQDDALSALDGYFEIWQKRRSTMMRAGALYAGRILLNRFPDLAMTIVKRRGYPAQMFLAASESMPLRRYDR